MPTAGGKLLDLLGVPEEKRMLADVGGRAAGSSPARPFRRLRGSYPRYVAPENLAE